MKKIVQLLASYLVPIASVLLLIPYVMGRGTPAQIAAWGARHGINEAIAMNYPRLNTVTFSAWILTIVLLLLRQRLFATASAAFATGYFFCDIMFYLPMVRTAGEKLPYDQFFYLALNLAYVAGLLFALHREKAQQAAFGNGSGHPVRGP
jgi:hypothetical protein